MRLLAAISALVVLTACENSAPIRDLCAAETSTPTYCDDLGQSETEAGGTTTSSSECNGTSLHSVEFCKACTSDSDCVIGGNPCCNFEHRWYCYNINITGLTFCDATCDLIPARPEDHRCQCIDGICRGG